MKHKSDLRWLEPFGTLPHQKCRSYGDPKPKPFTRSKKYPPEWFRGLPAFSASTLAKHFELEIALCLAGSLIQNAWHSAQCLTWCTERQVAVFVRSIESGSQRHRRKQLWRHKKRKRAKNSDEFNGHFGWFCVGWETISVSQCPYSNYECNMYTYRLEQPWTRKLYYRNQSIYHLLFLNFSKLCNWTYV